MSGERPVPSRLEPWWDRWPGRLEYELDRFAVRGMPLDVLEDPREGAPRLVVRTQVEVPGSGLTPVTVVYPDSYPHLRFSAIAPSLNFTRHRAPDGTLCLMPRGHRGWRSDKTAADVLAQQLPLLADLVEAGGEKMREAEDPQGEPVTEYFSSRLQGGIVLDERSVLQIEPADGCSGTATVAVTRPEFLTEYQSGQPLRAFLGRGLLLEVRSAESEVINSPHTSPDDAAYGVKLTAPWVHLDDVPYSADAAELLRAARAASPLVDEAVRKSSGRQLIAVHLMEEVSQGVHEPTWTFVTYTARDVQGKKSGDPRKKQEPRLGGVTHVRGMRRFDTDMSQRIPNLAPLRSKKVTLIGLGSIGMPIAQEFVKARIKHLAAVDHDSLDPATSVRHPMGLAAAGQSKPLALALWAADHDPDVEVLPFVAPVGRAVAQQEADGITETDMLQEALEGTSLVIGATAEHDVNRLLDDLGIEYGIPRLFVWSQSGYGGIITLLTRDTGCFHCFELLQRDHLAAVNPLVDVPAEEVAGAVIQGRGCADKTFTAAHTDLLPLSIEAARVATDLLGRDDVVQPYGLGALTLQNRDAASGRPIPPRWGHVPVPPHAECPRCHPR